MMASRSGEMTVSKIDPCGICGKKVMADSILFTNCQKWVHERCTKIEKVTPNLAINFVCARCRKLVERAVEPVENLCSEVEMVNSWLFGQQIECYWMVWNSYNKIWVDGFRKWVYQKSVILVMLYGNATLFSRGNKCQF